MKLVCLFLLAALVQVSAATYAQKTKLSVSGQNLTIERVLGQIEDQSEFSFFYNSQEVDLSKEISLNLKDQTVDQVLDFLMTESGLRYTVNNKLIIIHNEQDSRFKELTSQARKISGKVTDLSGEPLPGVTVVVKGTILGTVTDFGGNYTISDVPAGGTLVFSFVGMRTEEILVGTQSSINVVLAEDAIGIEEVVAIGYGVQKKSDVTGAMVSVSADELTARPVNNAIEAMQGKVAGVDITSSERPGTVGNITIRGVRSLTASNNPLYVLDGIPLITGNIQNVNPADIESIDILKDASATAIYGSRGANGVVIVTTKKGKAGKFTLTFDSSVTTEKIHEFAPLLNAGEFVEYRRWAKHYENPATYPRGDQPTQANDALIFSGDETAFNNILRGWEGGTWDGAKLVSTDWTDFVTRTGLTT